MLFSANKATNSVLFYPLTVPISRNALSEKLKNFYLVKSPKTHATLVEHRFHSAVNLEKWRLKLHNYELLTNFLELFEPYSLMLNHILKYSMWKNNNNFRLIQVFYSNFLKTRFRHVSVYYQVMFTTDEQFLFLQFYSDIRRK